MELASTGKPILQAVIDTKMAALAQRLADAAGNVLRRHHRAPVMVQRKADATPVTQADREVEAAMRALIEQAYPDHGIFGEEYGSVRNTSPFQWVLDPIDGTRAFIAGYPTFTTLIALSRDGVPVLGIIDQPILKERWVGIVGHATTLNGKLVTPRSVSMLSESVIATTSIDYFTPAQAELFSRLKSQCANSIAGGDAYAYAMLASGRIDVIIDTGLKPYDFCALKAVVEGAGGVITDWQGRSLTTASDGSVIAAASSALHRQVIQSLQPAI